MPDEVGDVQTTTEDMEFPDDPMDSIRREDARLRDDELETALQKLVGDDETPDDDDEVEDTGNGTSKTETAKPTSAKPAPIDKVLAQLKNSNLPPEMQEAIRATIATNTRLQQAQKGIDQRIDDAVRAGIEEALAELRQTSAPQDDDDPLANVSPEQVALFEKIAKRAGFVKATDLEERESSKSRQDYMAKAREEALTEFGDLFGMKDEDGNIVVSDENHERLQRRWEQLKAHGTPTIRDLFVAEFLPEIKKTEYERGLEAGRKERMGRRVERTAAITESRTGGGDVSLNIRGKKGTRADSSENVFARAALLAKRKYSRTS